MTQTEERILYIDCFSGAAGDMWLGALVDLGVPEHVILEPLACLPLGEWSLDFSKGSKNGIGGIDAKVRVGGKTELEVQHETHTHGKTIGEIQALLENSSLPEKVRTRALAVFHRLAAAEATIHQVEPTAVHFHEVGAIDAIVDIVGTCAAIEWLGVDHILCSPIPLGRGFVHCAHGDIPLPGPAVLALLEGCPTTGVQTQGELVTPTGAALITEHATDFGEYPEMHVEKVGYGVGDMDWPDRPNLLRLVLGTRKRDNKDSVLLLETNLDDMNPEWFGPLNESLLDLGAYDVWLTPIQMKKGRPAVKLSVLCPHDQHTQLVEKILVESTTLGVRIQAVNRVIAPRSVQTIDTPLGPCQIKVREIGDQIAGSPEFEDCLRLSKAHAMPLREVYRVVERSFEQISKPQKDPSHD